MRTPICHVPLDVVNNCDLMLEQMQKEHALALQKAAPHSFESAVANLAMLRCESLRRALVAAMRRVEV